MHRRTLLTLAPSAALLAGCGAAAHSDSAEKKKTSGGITLTDVLGRTVTLDSLPTRVFLGESRQVYTLAFLQKENPVDKVVAWPNDLMKAGPDMWKRLKNVAPHAADIPVVGSLAKGDLTLESVLAHKPEVAVLNLDSYEAAKSGGFFDQMDKAGLPWVVTDFRIKPVTNTRISVKALGAIFGRDTEADAFLSFYDGIVNPIMKASKARTSGRPTVFHWRSPGVSEPGRTYGDSNFGQITNASGGDNLGSQLLKGDEGTLSTEQLIKAQPELIIASGGEWQNQEIDSKSHTSYVHLGYDATAESARKSLAALEKETGYDQLNAFKGGMIFGIYHQFYNAPYNFIVYQAFASWQGLDGFQDVDVDASWIKFHQKFMPWKAEGTVAIGLHA